MHRPLPTAVRQVAVQMLLSHNSQFRAHRAKDRETRQEDELAAFAIWFLAPQFDKSGALLDECARSPLKSLRLMALLSGRELSLPQLHAITEHSGLDEPGQEARRRIKQLSDSRPLERLPCPD